MASFVDKLKSRRGVRQFAKFVIVGASSTAIDWGLHFLLWQNGQTLLSKNINAWVLANFPRLEHPDFDASFTALKAVSFIVATLNGFFWNRRWTFRITDKERWHAEVLKFYVVSGIGLLINTLVASQVHVPNSGAANVILAYAAATFVTMFWNFSGHKFWTFRRKKSP